jgi:hypothetical protein
VCVFIVACVYLYLWGDFVCFRKSPFWSLIGVLGVAGYGTSVANRYGVLGCQPELCFICGAPDSRGSGFGFLSRGGEPRPYGRCAECNAERDTERDAKNSVSPPFLFSQIAPLFPQKTDLRYPHKIAFLYGWRCIRL